MIRYTIRRLLWGVVVLLALSLATFVLFGPVLQSTAGVDAAQIVAGQHAGPAQIEQTRRFLGLNKPWYEQYEIYMRRVVLGPSKDDKDRVCVAGQSCGDQVGRLGTSFENSRAVDWEIKQAFPITLQLSVVTAFIWILLSIPIGVLSALKRGSILDRSSMVVVLLGQSLPVYYFGLLALYFLAYKLGIFPLDGYRDLDWSNPWPWLDHMILPGATLALQFAALYVRMVRSNMLGVMNEDYIRTARAKGASPRRVVVRHGLRNALLPVITMFGMDFGLLLGGAILTEYTFGLPGIGRLTVSASGSLDVPTVNGLVLFAGALIVIFNLGVDLLYSVFDPRIRLA
jgi:peptide/nickel transport system permease protein